MVRGYYGLPETNALNCNKAINHDSIPRDTAFPIFPLDDFHMVVRVGCHEPRIFVFSDGEGRNGLANAHAMNGCAAAVIPQDGMIGWVAKGLFGVASVSFEVLTDGIADGEIDDLVDVRLGEHVSEGLAHHVVVLSVLIGAGSAVEGVLMEPPRNTMVHAVGHENRFDSRARVFQERIPRLLNQLAETARAPLQKVLFLGRVTQLLDSGARGEGYDQRINSMVAVIVAGPMSFCCEEP